MRMISVFRIFGVSSVMIMAFACAQQASAVTIKIDYKYDTDKFFEEGTQARAAMDAAASYFSTILEDTFAEIDVPNKYYGSRGGEATWFWKRRFTNPQTGFNVAEINAGVNENEYIVYAGARDLSLSGELGLGGAGGFVEGFVRRNGEFTAAETAEINSMQAEFADAVLDRGETSGFGRWGGSIAFNSEADWHFNHTTNPPVDTTPLDPSDNVYDFYSVALHELAHAIGFGIVDNDATTKTPWENLVEIVKEDPTDEESAEVARFNGTNAVASYVPAGNVPLASTDDTSHWPQGIVASPIYGETGTQLPLMVPEQVNNVRSLLTDLDVAALVDIGWDIDLPPSSASAASIVSVSSASTYSGAVSYAALSVSAVPEPASAILAAFAGSLLMGTRRRR